MPSESTPTYVVTADADSVVEGSTLTFTISTTGIAEGELVEFYLGGSALSRDYTIDESRYPEGRVKDRTR